MGPIDDKAALRDLAERIGRGDQEAEDSLFRQYEERLLFFVRRRVRKSGLQERAATVEDICQDSWLAVIENLRRCLLKDNQKVSSYIYQVFSNKVNDALDKARREHPEELNESLSAQSDGGASSRQSMSETDKAVQKVLGKMRSGDVDILELKYLACWSHDRIADLIGISTGACRKRLQRAKERITKELGRG